MALPKRSEEQRWQQNKQPTIALSKHPHPSGVTTATLPSSALKRRMLLGSRGRNLNMEPPTRLGRAAPARLAVPLRRDRTRRKKKLVRPTKCFVTARRQKGLLLSRLHSDRARPTDASRREGRSDWVRGRFARVFLCRPQSVIGRPEHQWDRH